MKNKNIEDFQKGQCVNVISREGDYFTNDFTGIVKGFHRGCVTVEDADGDCWDCDPEQLSYCSDEYMH
jgi:hypothetical protein